MKRQKVNSKASKKMFLKTVTRQNSKNKPTLSRGGVRF